MATQPEFEGKDLEDALEQAAEALDVPEEDLHYEIVEQGRRGVFGLGAKSVRIRVIPPIDAVPAEDAAAPAPRKSEPKSEPKPKAKSRQRSRSRRSRSSRGPKRESAPAPDQEKQIDLLPVDTEVQATVRRMVELIGLDLDVDMIRTEGGLNLKLDGADRKTLSSRNGELQSAIQFLLNRMARRTWPDVGRIYIGEGKSRKRDEDIVSLAKRVAKQVTQSGKTKKLQPMNAYERRLVHLTIREYPGLSSSSDGSGSMKRVRVSKIQNNAI